MAPRKFALEAEGLSKAYRMYGSPLKRIAEAVSLGRYKGHHEFWALQDVSMKLVPGSSLGLCGANGAGKSTLLKVLAGTTAPTRGRYRIDGRVASLLELGAGFHMDFTGRANILMNGVMMGFSKKEIARKTDEIIEFAELGDYIDEPVRTYSSGMGLRLGFSVAVTVQPDVLIIDEVFAVGDMYFQKKCVDKIYEFKKKNRTILFCSHSLYDVRQLCGDAIWLDHGVAKAQGESVFVTNEYSAFQRHNIDDLKEVIGDTYPKVEVAPGSSRSELPSILDARIYKMGTDEETYQILTGDSIEVRVWWKNPAPEKTPVHLAMGFLRQDMTTLAGTTTDIDQVEVAGTEGTAILRYPNVQLLAGQFLIPVLLLDEEGIHKYQEYLMPENLVIRNSTKEAGAVRMEHHWDFADLPLPTEKREPSEATAGEV